MSPTSRRRGRRRRGRRGGPRRRCFAREAQGVPAGAPGLVVAAAPADATAGPSWAVLEAILGCLGGVLEAILECLGGLLGRLGAILEASWAVLAVLKRRTAEKTRKPKSFQNHCKIDDFGLSGPSCEASWRHPGASWRPLGPSWGHLGRLGAFFRRLGGLLGRFSGPCLADGALQGRARHTRQSRGVPGNPGESPGILVKMAVWPLKRNLTTSMPVRTA